MTAQPTKKGFAKTSFWPADELGPTATRREKSPPLFAAAKQFSEPRAKLGLKGEVRTLNDENRTRKDFQSETKAEIL